VNDLIHLALGMLWGITLGGFYFCGLWLTIQHLPRSGQPSLLALSSFLGRSAACLFGFYLAAGNGLGWLALSLAGFVLAKAILLRHQEPVGHLCARKEAD